MSSSALISRFLMVAGVILMLLFFYGLVMQLATTEAFMGGPAVHLGNPNWGIFLQPVQLARGELNPTLASAAFVAFLIEGIYVVVVMGGEIVMETIEKGSKVFSRWFKLIVIGLVIANGIFDYNYGSIGASYGIWGHVLFAIAIAFSVGVCGTIGLVCIMKGWGHA